MPPISLANAIRGRASVSVFGTAKMMLFVMKRAICIKNNWSSLWVFLQIPLTVKAMRCSYRDNSRMKSPHLKLIKR